MNNNYETILRRFGYKKVPWNKCPQGFEKANYPCYTHKDHNVWVEVYKTDPLPYGWIIADSTKSSLGTNRGQFFDDIRELQFLLKKINQQGR